MSNAALDRRLDAAAETVIGLFLHNVHVQPHVSAARFKQEGKWRSMTWSEMAAEARELAYGLAALGVDFGDRVGLLGGTSLQWVLAELGLQMAGAISVPLYQTCSPRDVAYIAGDSGAKVLVVDDAEQLAKVSAVRAELPLLQAVVVLRGGGDGEWSFSLEQLLDAGAALAVRDPELVDVRIHGLRSWHTASLLYTPGTTGSPKGVILSHGAWAFEGNALAALGLIDEEDLQLLFLPLADSFAQSLKVGWFGTGSEIAFAETVEGIVEDVGQVHPTVMAAVPRVFETVYADVLTRGEGAPGIRGTMFRFAMRQLDRYVQARRMGRPFRSLRFDLARWLVFRTIAARLEQTLGGRMRLCFSNGSPLSPRIAWFFQVLDASVLEGWGLTETAGVATVNRPTLNKIGTVGSPLPGIELRIAEDGEVLVRGENIMKGYWGLPRATIQALDEAGWFHTGDVGRRDGDGYLTITERKQDLITTATGARIAPKDLESELRANPLVSHALVHGEGRPYLVALLTLEPRRIKQWSIENDLDGLNLPSLAVHPAVHAKLQQWVDALNAQLYSDTTIRRFALLGRDFTQASGELTPTSKVKRRLVEARYAAELAKLYEG